MLTNDWRKATASQTSGCLEARWMTATASTGVNCVEVAHHHGRVEVRDSKDPDGLTVAFTTLRWRLLLAQAITGRFPWEMLWPLTFDEAERAAFISGARRGEFSLPEPPEREQAAEAGRG